jgi:hypothetical protein
VEVISYTEPSYGDTQGRFLDQYQAISAQAECADLSLDELRLADYEQGYGTASVNTSKSVETTTTWPLQMLPRSDDRKQNSHVDLYVLSQSIYLADNLYEQAPRPRYRNPHRNRA